MTPPKRLVAYFTMEIALRSDIPTYSGGLGVLAGDTVRSAADLELPLVTVSASWAARRIVRAVERGERFLVLGVPAKLLRLVHALFPGPLVGMLGQLNRLLPSTPLDEQGDDRMPLPAELFRRGLARSILTALGERAAHQNNEDPAAKEGG